MIRTNDAPSYLNGTMAETHTLQLKIDATAARVGSRDFTAAINTVKMVVRDLDRDTNGAFTKLITLKPRIDIISNNRASTDANTLTTALTGTGILGTGVSGGAADGAGGSIRSGLGHRKGAWHGAGSV